MSAFLALYESGSEPEGLRKWLEDNVSDMNEWLQEQAPKLELHKVVAGVFAACADSSSTSSKHMRFAAADASLQMASSNVLSCKEASDVLDVLSDQAHTFSTRALVSLVNDVVEHIEEGTMSEGLALSFIPVALSKILPDAAVQSEGEDMTGEAYKAQVTLRLTTAQWRPETCVQLLGAMRDLQLTDEERKRVVDKTVDLQMGETALSLLPPLVYQLLLIAGKGHKGDVIRRMVLHFEQLSLNAADKHQAQVRAAENAVLLHIDFALKQEASLGVEFLKALQKEPVPLSPFLLSLLLAMTRIHRHQERVLKYLTHLVAAGMGDDKEDPRWTRVARNERPEVSAAGDVLVRLAQQSAPGWNPTVEPLVGFVMTMMEARGKHSEAMCLVGREVLEHVFRGHEAVRPLVLEMCVNHILTHADLAIHYVDLLHRLAVKFPHELVSFGKQLKDVFDHLAIMPPHVALQLVRAMVPLLAMSHELKDHLMIVLRKAMFRGKGGHQLAAAGGIVHYLLECLRGREQNNQAFEAITFLERGLSQHPDVRRIVYRGLALVAKSREQATSTKVISVAVKRHLARFSDPEGKPPLKLELCLEGSQVVEPLGALMFTAFTVGHEARQLVNALVARMQAAELEDYAFHKESEFDESPAGQHNLMLGTVLCEAYVAALECVVVRKEMGDAEAASVVTLFTVVAKLRQLMANGGSAGNDDNKRRKKRKVVVTAGIPPSVQRHMDPSSLRVLVRALCAVKGVEASVQQRLRDSKQLITYVLEQLLIHVAPGTDAHDTHWRWAVPMTSTETQEKMLFCREVGPSVYAEFQRDQAEWNETVMLCLLHMMKHVHGSLGDTDALLEFLEDMNPLREENDSQQQMLARQLHSLHSYLGPLIDQESWKQVIVMCHMLELLFGCLEDSHIIREQCTLMEKLMERREVAHAQASKALVGVYLALAARGKSRHGAIQKMCEQLVGYIGSIKDEEDEEEDVHEPTNTFQVINKKTLSAVLSLTLGAFDETLNEVDAVLPLLRGEREGEFYVEQLRAATHKHLRGALEALAMLLDTHLPWGTTTERIVKLTTRVYQQITKIIKVYTVQKHLPGDELAHLFLTVGASLDNAYSCLSNLRRQETASMSEKAAKAQMRRETRVKPALIYSIEMMETTTIKYQLVAKVSLMKNWKRSAVRDFRINAETLKEIQEKEEDAGGGQSEDEQGEDEDEEEEEEEQEQGAKKRKKPKARTPAKKKSRAAASGGQRRRKRVTEVSEKAKD